MQGIEGGMKQRKTPEQYAREVLDAWSITDGYGHDLIVVVARTIRRAIAADRKRRG